MGVCSPAVGNPSCLQTTRASTSPQKSSHTVPQVLLKHTSTRPSSSVRPPTSLTSPVLQTRLTNQYITNIILVTSVSSEGLTGSSAVHFISASNTVPKAITHKRFWDATPTECTNPPKGAGDLPIFTACVSKTNSICMRLALFPSLPTVCFVV